MIKDNDDDVLAKNPSHNAFSQLIRRERRKNEVTIKEPVDLKELVVPDH